MKRSIFTVIIAFTMLLTLTANGLAQQAVKNLRVGVYDNRAITFAYMGSKYNPMEKKMTEYIEAKAAGDSAQIKELEAWGPRFQRQLHFQGFGRAPVDDLLLLVKDKIPDVAKRTGVDLIGWYPDYTGADVEIVDITDELVSLFNPTNEKLEEIKQITAVEPTPLCDLTNDD
ncbi:MAG: hypothetical protein E4H13_06305 [Calditrichales bacterium]|nr:MAG: hypothetical protein E4H13_06305 [Calditrichales bacterium]